MLENSKSIYFIKKLFTFVDEKTKLDIIKYNKNMQNIMDINLINYKFYSKKYIMYEENGKGKEYNGYDNRLEFEGEYLNGKRNGKGKEYYGYGTLSFVYNFPFHLFPFKYSPSNIKYLPKYSFPFPFLFPFKYSPLYIKLK